VTAVEELLAALRGRLDALARASALPGFTPEQAREHVAGLGPAADDLARGIEVARRARAGEGERIDEVVAALSGMAALDFSHRVSFCGDGGSLDALAAMTNMLSEELEASQQALAERNALAERLAIIVESSEDAIVSCDLAGVITTWNRGAAALYGYPVAHAVGRPIARLVAPERHAQVESIWRSIAAGVHVSHFETVAVRADGTQMSVSLSASPLVDGKGEVVGISTIARDLTVTQRLAAELAQAKEIAEAATVAKSQFLANMSHELRTPLTALLGFADLLVSLPLSPSERLDYAMTIRRNGEHLRSLLNDILDLSKIEAGKLEISRVDCSVAWVLNDVASLMRVRAVESGLDFDVHLLTPIPAIQRTDPTRLRQILLNLVGNAVKFTRSGSVRILVRYEPRAAPPRLVIDVTDTGIGMSGEQLALLFRPFHQADPSMSRRFGGTGLGLAISRPLAEALGGTITVRSALDEGSTFTLTLTADVPPGTALISSISEGPAMTPIEGGQRAPEQLAGKVLVVEDGPDNQQLLGTILRKHGLTVALAENGEIAARRALEALAAGAPFDLILMDMQMPVLDGYGATTRLRREGYRGPIVALTAHAMGGERERCLAAGCDDYLSKPIDRAELYAAVDRYLPGRRAQSAVAPAPRRGMLYSTMAGDPDMAPLIERFVESLPVRVSAMRDAAEREDTQALTRLVHQLKGAAGGYGFALITDATAQLERALRADPRAAGPAGRLLDELTGLCQRARAGAGAGDEPPKAGGALLTVAGRGAVGPAAGDEEREQGGRHA
jgi:PAS domain S-box-containing protein